MHGLTEKQQTILNFIEDFHERNGCPPTVQEIAEHVKVKSSTVFAHLRALQRKNQLSRSSKARSLTVTNPRLSLSRLPSGIWTIPLLGRVSAGCPAESIEDRESVWTVAAGIGNCRDPKKLFALQIQGESMRDLGIMEGDVVIVHPLEEAPRPGDIVVAVVPGGECTVKSYFPHNEDSIELRPANPDYQVQIHAKDQVRIQGKVIALQRNY